MERFKKEITVNNEPRVFEFSKMKNMNGVKFYNNWTHGVWGNDQAYKEVVFKLDQVEQELDTLLASPGRRASLRAASASSAGQEPKDRSEPPSEAQSGR